MDLHALLVKSQQHEKVPVQNKLFVFAADFDVRLAAFEAAERTEVEFSDAFLFGLDVVGQVVQVAVEGQVAGRWLAGGRSQVYQFRAFCWFDSGYLAKQDCITHMSLSTFNLFKNLDDLLELDLRSNWKAHDHFSVFQRALDLE